ncbi:MAG TPA: DsrE family protein [Sulfuricella sp.]|nr:DsrE family protein [Sulfuricella sp.]
MIKQYGTWFLAAILTCWISLAVAQDEEKVLYHINDSTVARMALGNIRNHLNATEDKVKIVVVAHGNGVDFLLEGAQDKNGNPYNIAVEELMARGVDFRVCNNTLKGRKIDPKMVLQGAKIVPSGVAEIGRLQAREGYAYIKP